MSAAAGKPMRRKTEKTKIQFAAEALVSRVEAFRRGACGSA